MLMKKMICGDTYITGQAGKKERKKVISYELLVISGKL